MEIYYININDKRRSLASIILQNFIISKFHKITISKNNDNFNPIFFKYIN